MIGLCFFPCSALVPLSAIFAALLLRGKGYPDPARWAWRAAALLLAGPFASLGGMFLAVAADWDWAAWLGMVASATLHFGGNLCAAVAASRDSRRLPAQVYAVGCLIAALTVGLVIVLVADSGPPGDLEVVLAMVGVPGAGLWWWAAGAGMALVRSLVESRVYDDFQEG